MQILPLIFYGLSAITIASAIMVISSNNPVRSVLFLVLTFIASAGIWLLTQAEFLALILILVYVGAVMTLFLFVVMMLNIDFATQKQRFVRYLPLGLIIAALLILLMFMAIQPQYFGIEHLQQATAQAADFSNVKQLGAVLYTQYAVDFELAGVLLLVAIVSAISLAHRPPRKCKTQDPVAQMMVQAKDRISLKTGEENL